MPQGKRRGGADMHVSQAGSTINTVLSQVRDLMQLKNERLVDLARVLREPQAFGLVTQEQHAAVVRVAQEEAARTTVQEQELSEKTVLIRKLQAEVSALRRLREDDAAAFQETIDAVKTKAVEQASMFAELEQQHEAVRRRDNQHAAVLADAEARCAEMRARLATQRERHAQAIRDLELKHQQDLLAHRRDLAVLQANRKPR